MGDDGGGWGRMGKHGKDRRGREGWSWCDKESQGLKDRGGWTRAGKAKRKEKTCEIGTDE